MTHMVSTRRSLVSLGVASHTETRSNGVNVNTPSPKKRKFDDTPEQRFVDARATPFAQRKRDPSLSSEELSDSVESVEVEQSATTAMAGTKSSTTISDSNDSNDSDDEAPEAVSNVTSARDAKLSQIAQKELLKSQASESKQKRRMRDEKFKTQKTELRRAQKSDTDAALAEDDTVPLKRSSEPSPKITRKVIPRMLPDEILNAPQISAVYTGVEVPQQLARASNHIKFEPKKEKTVLHKGPLTVRLLKKQRKDLAPKQAPSAANTKNQWLYQRGAHNANRRPVRKPLS